MYFQSELTLFAKETILCSVSEYLVYCCLMRLCKNHAYLQTPSVEIEALFLRFDSNDTDQPLNRAVLNRWI